ncbi:MAG TPA: TonB family protein, partial [Croceibacterium sp.]|nr:TonB family protein [Croceibacterium sp.]
VPLPPPEAPRDWPSATDEPTTTDTSWLPVGDGESENLPASSTVPPFNPKRATPSNNSSNWITNDDYPRRALVDGAEGSVGYRLVVSTLGRVASCELTQPSGNRALDDATCRLITRRARFEAATDETGAKVLGTYSGSVRWEIPE